MPRNKPFVLTPTEALGSVSPDVLEALPTIAPGNTDSFRAVMHLEDLWWRADESPLLRVFADMVALVGIRSGDIYARYDAAAGLYTHLDSEFWTDPRDLPGSGRYAAMSTGCLRELTGSYSPGRQRLLKIFNIAPEHTPESSPLLRSYDNQVAYHDPGTVLPLKGLFRVARPTAEPVRRLFWVSEPM
jgi:hypothetical protein